MEFILSQHHTHPIWKLQKTIHRRPTSFQQQRKLNNNRKVGRVAAGSASYDNQVRLAKQKRIVIVYTRACGGILSLFCLCFTLLGLLKR